MLKLVLLANAASCAVFGALFVWFSNDTAAFIGDPPALLLRILGIGLLANAGMLTVTSLRPKPPRRDILFFIAGDVSWVLITGVLLFTGIWITTAAGVGWSVAVASFVALCALLQWRLVPKTIQKA